jgi:hypothetical protein
LGDGSFGCLVSGACMGDIKWTGGFDWMGILGS